MCCAAWSRPSLRLFYAFSLDDDENEAISTCTFGPLWMLTGGGRKWMGCGRVADANSVGQKPGVWCAVGRVNDGFSLEQAWSEDGVGRHGACWGREVDAAINVRIVRGIGSGAEMWEVNDGPVEIEGTVAAL